MVHSLGNLCFMRRNLVLFLCSILTCALYAQDPILDSLQLKLRETTNDIDRTLLYNAIATQYKYSDAKKMAEYGEKALALAQNIDHDIAKGNAYLNIGTSNIILGESLSHFTSFY